MKSRLWSRSKARSYMSAFGFGNTSYPATYYYLPRIGHRRRSIKGRARSRRFFQQLLTPRQLFCLQYLGRYTLRGSEGTLYKIEMDLSNSHQWFYVLSKSGQRYYFSLIVSNSSRGDSDAEDVYRNLASIHVALITDERQALATANWDWQKDKERWLKRRQHFPLRVTFANDQHGKSSSYVDYFRPYLESYWS